jgi:hypothetical protein
MTSTSPSTSTSTNESVPTDPARAFGTFAEGVRSGPGAVYDGAMFARAHVFLIAVLLLACDKKESPPQGSTAAATAATTAAPATATAANAAATPPPGSPPPDGKYERVTVEGVTVPMINVMNGGAVVLVDTDGKKPRSWEEQYKRKRPDLLPGQYDLHKTNKNGNDTFEDDEIDKEGLWVIDAKGNITRH